MASLYFLCHRDLMRELELVATFELNSVATSTSKFLKLVVSPVVKEPQNSHVEEFLIAV